MTKNANQSHGLRASSALAGVFLIGAVVAFQFNAQASPQTTPPDNTRSAVTYDIGRPGLAELIRDVKPAVVSIGIEKTVLPARFEGAPQVRGQGQEWMHRFFGAPGRQAPPSQKMQGQGSGFVIDADGYIVTNQHVIDGAESIVVVFDDGERLDAKLIGLDEKTDLALLKVESDAPLPFVEFGDSDNADVGDPVVAIGNPFGFGGTATTGIISARGRDLQSGPYVDFLQIDAPINSGNSGGPIFDARGQVIGVNTAIYSPNGGNVGIGFAIPAATAMDIVADLRADGQVERGYLGVQIQDLDEALAESLGLDSTDGALVADVVAGSPAAKAGIEVGDVITRFADETVKNAKDLTRQVGRADAGSRSKLTVFRNGSARTLQANIGAPQPQTVAANQEANELGLELAPLGTREREALGLDEDVAGAVVVAVERGSDAAEKGIRRGDVISRVNQQSIDDPRDVHAAIEAAKQSHRNSIAVLVKRGAGKRFVTLALA